MWRSIGDGRDWPDDDGWRTLAAADRLDELEPPRRLTPTNGVVEIEFELPMPVVSYLELRPVCRYSMT